MKFKPMTISIVPTERDKEVLRRLDSAYIQYSEMSESQREFLTTLILKNKPQKLIELGVSAGGSAVAMLNAIQDIDDAKLYSIDYKDKYYLDDSKDVGFIVGESYPSLLSKWKLYSGGMAYKFMDEIGDNIDFAMIDTAHCNPGEILDFLMVLPYLKEDATVVFHDTALHTLHGCPSDPQNCYTTCLLMSAIFGEKLTKGNFVKSENSQFSNIAAIKINAETRTRLWEVFNLLTIKWQYIPSDTELDELVAYLDRFYDEEFMMYLRDVIHHHTHKPVYPAPPIIVHESFASSLLQRIKAKVRSFFGRIFGQDEVTQHV